MSNVWSSVVVNVKLFAPILCFSTYVALGVARIKRRPLCPWEKISCFFKQLYLTQPVIEKRMDTDGLHTECVWKCIAPFPQGGNTHYHGTSLWGDAAHWNLKYVSHHDQNTQQWLCNSHVSDTTERHKGTRSRRITLWFHNCFLSHHWNKIQNVSP